MPRRGVRLIAGGVTTGRRGYAPSPLRPSGAREKKWERRRSAIGLACTPPRCSGEKGEGSRTPGVAPRLISTAPSGQWHEGVLHFSNSLSASQVDGINVLCNKFGKLASLGDSVALADYGAPLISALIQARMSSRRFPSKVLAPLRGRLILW